MSKFNIPKEPLPPKSTEPMSMLIYSAPKAGKTAITAQLPNSLIVEHEKNGINAVKARFIEVFNPNDVIPLLEEVKLDPSIDFIVIDTVTQWDTWSELVGTYSFTKKPQGKNWNVIDGKRVSHKHPAFETVHALGQGFGYRYSRDVMSEWFKTAINTGKKVIFLAHIKDKFIEAKSGDVVEAIDINLTGKVKNIYSANADCVAHLKRTGNKSHLVFQNLGKSVSGSRYPYLQGSILIGESNEETFELTTYWEDIFPSLKKQK